MLFSSELNQIEGIIEAAAMMGTEQNIDLMSQSGILQEEYIPQITPNDLVIGVKAESQDVIDLALERLEDLFNQKQKASTDSTMMQVKTVEEAIEVFPDLNLAIISTPGSFAKREAMKALKNDLHVMIFSDNVPVEDEIALKDYAVEKGLLLMGPDCGTAIINGVGLGFANVVRRGNIGITAASGTGLQEVSVIIDKLGGGISQALGTGGRDVQEQVGGRMMLLTLDALANDPQTEVIGIISKPPAERVMKKIIEYAKTIQKPIVACFLGGDETLLENTNIIPAQTLEEAAYLLVKLANKEMHQLLNQDFTIDVTDWLDDVPESSAPYIRALYTGGTLANESLLILSKSLGDVYSNIAIDPNYQLDNPETSKEHTVIDMGEDYFTSGKPHPMIDPDTRKQRIIAEGKDPLTGVILFDCVLGYGSHQNPAQSIVEAVNVVRAEREDIVFVASVTGTEQDPQSLSIVETFLSDHGVYVLPTNAQAARFALNVLEKRGVNNG